MSLEKMVSRYGAYGELFDYSVIFSGLKHGW